jgi:hypothetical protein
MLRSGGMVFGCAPFMGLGGTNDPLDLGEFMMKMKFDLTGKPYLDRETLRKAMGETFDYVDVASMGHMTAFVSGLKPVKM